MIQCSTNAIFFFEVLMVCSSIHISECFPGVTCLLVATDNTNMFDIFASLHAQLTYNPILILVVNVLRHDINLRVIYIPEPLNHVTGTLL